MVMMHLLHREIYQEQVLRKSHRVMLQNVHKNRLIPNRDIHIKSRLTLNLSQRHVITPVKVMTETIRLNVQNLPKNIINRIVILLGKMLKLTGKIRILQKEILKHIRNLNLITREVTTNQLIITQAEAIVNHQGHLREPIHNHQGLLQKVIHNQQNPGIAKVILHHQGQVAADHILHHQGQVVPLLLVQAEVQVQAAHPGEEGNINFIYKLNENGQANFFNCSLFKTTQLNY